jgi:hypothetical protein
MRGLVRQSWRWALLGVTLFALTGCDPTVRSTVEDGVINVSSGLFGSFLQAAIQLAIEANTPAS